MPHPSFAIQIESGGTSLQDRAVVIEVGPALILAVADGAGGTSHGDRAADLVIDRIKALVDQGGPFDEETSWRAFLDEVDQSIARDDLPGESTAVVLATSAAWICGASVGDSEAWLIADGKWLDLTTRQRRKPLLGSGLARAVAFRHEGQGGVLIVGSDGLFKYASPLLIRSRVLDGDPDQACSTLIDLARMPNGKLQDDIAVIVCHRDASA